MQLERDHFFDSYHPAELGISSESLSLNRVSDLVNIVVVYPWHYGIAIA